MTRNQADLLLAFLDRYRRASVAGPVPPLFIVDDGSTDATPDLLAAAAREGLAAFDRRPAGGIAAARNRVLERMKTAWIAFSDTDCELRPDYFERLFRTVQDRPETVWALEGAVLAGPKTRPFTHGLRNAKGGMFATANMVYRRERVLALGGFDPAFGNFREDVDLALRIQEAGGSIVFDPELRVRHPHLPRSFLPALRLAFARSLQVTRSEERLFAQHPGRYASVRFHPTGPKTLRSFRLGWAWQQIRSDLRLLSRFELRHLHRWAALLGVSLAEQAGFVLAALRPSDLSAGTGSRIPPKTGLGSIPGTEGRTVPEKPRILLLWTGAVVPAYRGFFRDLGRESRLLVLSPRRWRHGGVDFEAEPEAPGASYVHHVTPFLRWGRAASLVPALPLHLLSFKPDIVYHLEELDRWSLVLTGLITRFFRPRATLTAYALQNLARPAYHRLHHRLALRLNRFLVPAAAAATPAAAAVLKAWGFCGRMALLPLFVDLEYFRPAAPADKAALRQGFGFGEDRVVIAYAGSLSADKGLPLLAEALSRPSLAGYSLATAGAGPELSGLTGRLGERHRHFGPLFGPDLVRFYQAADLVILPSRSTAQWKEQVGRSLLEGIACGCLALGSDSGSIPSITLFPALTFAEGSAADLVRILEALPEASLPALREAQLRQVREVFSTQAVARNTLSFLAPPPAEKA